ncbi:MAG: ABC transporter substrate-binding protein, partial [Firmicutes bacterium]|nr:ABC transporter substrate-binding protein [Bacillota bacterium]
GEFFQGNTVFFYRNPFFTYGPGDDEFGLGGPARIHRLSMRVFSRAQIVASMEAGEFHYVMTDSMPRDQHPVQNSRTLAGVSLPNLGWGYVGINAGLIQDIRVRRAIMYVLNPDRTLAYYQGLSHRVTRATSRNNWVFWNPVTNVPEFPECRYPFAIYRERAGGGYELNPTGIANVMSLFEAAGYTREGATAGTGEFTGFQVGGRLVNPQGVQLRLTFTLPGDTLDHPARDMFLDAARYLEVLFGANTSVISDPLVLSRLATGQLQIWAAAFGGGIDPDMFGLFHMHSRNSIINAWGFSAISDQQAPQYGPGAIPIVAGSEDDQWALLQRLADEIIAGREVTGRAARTPRYITAHDTLMDLAVVLPTYERENMFIMNQRAIDMSTTYGNRPGEELSRFRGPLYNLPLLSFNI